MTNVVSCAIAIMMMSMRKATAEHAAEASARLNCARADVPHISSMSYAYGCYFVVTHLTIINVCAVDIAGCRLARP